MTETRASAPRSNADAAAPIIRERRIQLDGLRALAVSAVIFHHYVAPGVLGMLGVGLFFVLSGFLITGILLDLRDNGTMPMRRRIGSFYVRRVLRLVPAYLVVVLAAAALGLGSAREDLPWHLLYLSNWLFALRDAFPAALAHLWTLSVEEQFYLLWPLAICFLPRRLLVPAIAGVAAASLLFRLAAHELTDGALVMWIATPAAAGWLAVGSLLVIWMRHRPSAPAAAGWLLAAGIAAALLGEWLLAGAWYMTLGLTLWMVPLAMLVHGGYAGFRGPLGAFLASRLLTYTGRISYGLYLYHMPVWQVLYEIRSAAPDPGLLRGRLLAVVAAAATFGIAALSWALLERPIYRLRSRFPYR